MTQFNESTKKISIGECIVLFRISFISKLQMGKMISKTQKVKIRGTSQNLFQTHFLTNAF